MTVPLPRDVGLWSGFLDRLPAHEAVAAARGETLNVIAETTTRNFFRLFKDARPQ